MAPWLTLLDALVPLAHAEDVASPARSGPSGLTLMVAAYALVWGVLLLYVVSVARRQRAVERDLEELSRQVQELAGDENGA